MRAAFIAAILALAAGPGHAMEPLAPVQQQLFACGAGGHGLTRVAFSPRAASCCAKGARCAEALSTTILARPGGAFRT